MCGYIHKKHPTQQISQAAVKATSVMPQQSPKQVLSRERFHKLDISVL